MKKESVHAHRLSSYNNKLEHVLLLSFLNNIHICTNGVQTYVAKLRKSVLSLIVGVVLAVATAGTDGLGAVSVRALC